MLEKGHINSSKSISENDDELTLPKEYERPPPKAGKVPKPEAENPYSNLDEPGLNKMASVPANQKRISVNPGDNQSKRDKLMNQLSQKPKPKQ